MTRKITLLRKYLTKNPAQTQKLGATLAKKFLKFPPKEKKALVLGLKGDLGGGKTTFLQGFAKGLGIKEKILSPTFIILKKFEIRNQLSGESQVTAKFETFYHIDCYRIKKPKEILDLGFKEIANNYRNIVAVEWADRISKIMPKNSITLLFQFIDRKTREIKIFHK